MVGLGCIRVGKARDGEEDGRQEEHAAAEHLVGGEIWAEGGGRGRSGVSQSRTSTSCIIREKFRYLGLSSHASRDMGVSSQAF